MREKKITFLGKFDIGLLVALAAAAFLLFLGNGYGGYGGLSGRSESSKSSKIRGIGDSSDSKKNGSTGSTDSLVQHPQLEVTIGNTVYGIYDLAEDQTIRIGETNVCQIKDGEARMTEADCPDQICVHSVPVTEKGGAIVCLPNHIVLRVINVREEEREIDTIAE